MVAGWGWGLRGWWWWGEGGAGNVSGAWECGSKGGVEEGGVFVVAIVRGVF